MPLLWPLHLSRLQHTAARLAITIPDWEQLTHDVIVAAKSANGVSVLKVQVSRGEGGRGYSPLGVSAANVVISHSALPDYRHLQQHGVKLAQAQLQLSVQPLLAGLKHCNRLEQVLLKQEALKRGIDDLLVCDHQGFVTETIAANLFLHRAGRWYTPELSRAGVAGVMRSHVLQQHTAIPEVNWQLPELAEVDAMVISNALMGLVPVHSYNNQTLNLALAKDWCDELTC